MSTTLLNVKKTVNRDGPRSRVFTGEVLHGNQLGRTIGFPTINLDADSIPEDTEPGVYAATVQLKNETYGGALYYGPRLVLDETKTVLEIFLLDFSQEIYGETIQFTLEKWVRGPMDFDTFPALQAQLQKDIQDVREFFAANPDEK